MQVHEKHCGMAKYFYKEFVVHHTITLNGVPLNCIRI